MGDEEFRELYVRLSKVVFSYAARRLTPEQAKDVVNQTFEAVWRKRNELPADHNDWTRWIVGIGKFQVLQELQRVKRKHHDNRFIDEHPKELQNVAWPDVADSVASSSQAKWIWQQLRVAEQELVNVAFVRGLSDCEAAALLGLTTTAYTTRTSRVRQRIASLYLASDTMQDAPAVGGAS